MRTDSIPFSGRRYQPLALLGRGGMGAVFSARDRLSGQTIAIKCLGEYNAQLDGEPDAAQSQKLRLALTREFHTLASLRHPNIISVLDFGFDAQRRPYFTMELLPSAETLTAAAVSLTLEGKLRLLAQLLRALMYLHHRGVLHRDLKPSNVLCVKEELKVLDFGISTRKESPEDLAGTLEYMAPELLIGQRPTSASDLYSFGVLAHQLLTGRFPYSRESVTRMLGRVLGETTTVTLTDAAQLLIASYRASSPSGSATHIDLDFADSEDADELSMDDVPAPLLGWLRRLLERQPTQRYQSAAQVLQDLNHAVGTSFPVETEATRESFLQAAELIGRTAQVAQLTQALERTLAGQGSAWLIGGESGVGKSRLLEELRTLALVRGARVVRGQAVSAGGAAYQVWREILRPLCLETDLDDTDAESLRTVLSDLPQLLGKEISAPSGLDPQNAQARFFAGVEQLLLAQKTPLVLLLEDLHWAEPTSLALLSRVLRLLRARLPLLIVGSYRNDERRSLPGELPDMQPLPLGRLSSTEIAALGGSMLGELGQRPEVVTLLEHETDGNAFFMVEVVRALAEEAGALGNIQTGRMPSRVVAGGVNAILARRLGRVPDAARPLLCAAAVLGRELDLNVLRELPDIPAASVEAHLQACAEVAVLEVSENRWRFAHDKLRESLLRELDGKTQAYWHRQNALAIERAYAADLSAHAAALGYHFDQAGEPQRAIPYCLQAGERATRSGAVHEAIAHLERAMVLSRTLQRTPAERAHAQALLCRAYNGAGRSEECAQMIEKMTEGAGYHVPQSPRELASAIAILVGKHARFRIGGRVAAASTAAHDPCLAEFVESAIAAGEVVAYTRSPTRVLFFVLTMVDAAERLGDAALLGPVYAVAGLVLSTTPLTGLHAGYLRRAQALIAQVADPPLTSQAYVKAILAVTHVQHGQWQRARDRLREELEYRRRAGDWSQELWTLLQSCTIELWHGSAEKFLELFAQMEELVRRVDSPRYACWGRSLRAALALRQGQQGLAARLLEDAGQQQARAEDVAAVVVCEGLSALCAWQRGEREAARKSADKTLTLLRTRPTFAYGQLFGVAALAEVYHLLWTTARDDAEQAELHRAMRQLLVQILRMATMFPIAHPLAFLGFGRYAAARGHTALARWLLTRALQRAQLHAMPFDEALVRQALAALPVAAD